MAFRIFLSYCEEDEAFGNRVFWMLYRLGLDPYADKLYPEPGEFIPDLVTGRIEESQFLVPLITRNGVQSQWVNQEIGAAHALRKYIIPLVETGVDSRGFVELRHRITYNPVDPEQAMGDLLRRMRTLLNPKWASYKCSTCDATFVTELPSPQETEEAIRRRQVFVAKCPQDHEIEMDPRTFEPVKGAQ